MKVTGQCHCGAIRYEAEVDPTRVHACHCTDCQRLSGSAYRVTVGTPSEKFRLLKGTPKIYVKTADSGNKRAHAFCDNCGSPVYSSAISDPPWYSLRVGCLDQRAQLPPVKQIWCRSSLGWAMNLENVPTVERQ
ncbi:MAG TPA: GFA family protein [Casimicrobiaceae bacterium]|nr:GFA family protein [Casimicrobiaceae bacterium]